MKVLFLPTRRKADIEAHQSQYLLATPEGVAEELLLVNQLEGKTTRARGLVVKVLFLSTRRKVNPGMRQS